MTQIRVNKLAFIGSDNGFSPGWRQSNIWINLILLLIWTFQTNFSEIFIEFHTSYFKKMHLNMSSGKFRPFCLGLNVLNMFSLIRYFSEMASDIWRHLALRRVWRLQFVYFIIKHLCDVNFFVYQHPKRCVWDDILYKQLRLMEAVEMALVTNSVMLFTCFLNGPVKWQWQLI